MANYRQCARGATIVGLFACALGLSSCQHTDNLAGHAELTGGREERSPHLTDPQRADVKIALGRSLELRGELDSATAIYLEALKQDPTRYDATLRLAIISDKQGKFQKSLELYQKALAAHPGDADIYCDMGYSLYLQHCWADAEMNLRQALALQPDHSRAHNNLGLVLVQLDHVDDALVEFHRGGCDEANARASVAFSLIMQKSWAAARQQYELALAADPTSVIARKGLQELAALAAKANLVEQQAVSWKDTAKLPEGSEPIAPVSQTSYAQPKTDKSN